jgi:hypothetical protein
MKRNAEEVFDLYMERGVDNSVKRTLALISLFENRIKEDSIVHPGYILGMIKEAKDVLLLQKIFIDLLLEEVQQSKIPAIEIKHPTLSQ